MGCVRCAFSLPGIRGKTRFVWYPSFTTQAKDPKMADFLTGVRDHLRFMDSLYEQTFHTWIELPSRVHAQDLAGDQADTLQPRADFVMEEARRFMWVVRTGNIHESFIQFLNEQMEDWFLVGGEDLSDEEIEAKRNFWTEKKLRVWIQEQGFKIPTTKKTSKK